jgi:cysteine-rich repeat protein
MCGDGVINQPNEECDGFDFGGHDCTELGFSNPSGIGCAGDCKLDTSNCAATCGDGVMEPGEQCDDSNTVDTDACSAKCQTQGDCSKPIQLMLPLGTADVSGTTSGMGVLTAGGCQEATGPELVFAVTPLHSGYLTVWTDPLGTDFDAIVYARMACQTNNDILCGDNNDAEPDLISFPVGDGMQPVIVVIDGYQGAAGDFLLHFDLSLGTDCNDPVPIALGDDQGFQEHALGNTTNANANESGSCGGNGNDVVYQVTRMTSPGPFSATTTSQGTLNSITYARSSCKSSGSELACSSVLNDNNSSIQVDPMANPTFVLIDAQTTQGAYHLVFDPSP